MNVAYPDPREGVRITGNREDGLDFGNVIADTGDGVDWGFAGEAEFAEGFKRTPQFRLVEPSGEAKNDTGLFQAVNSALNGGSGEADLFSNIAESSACVEAEELENCVVRLVKIKVAGHTINLPENQKLCNNLVSLCVSTLID